MAEAYFRHICQNAGLHNITVSSAGTYAGNGEPASEIAIQIMKKQGIDISGHKSSCLDREKIKSADIIVAMTASHRHYIGSLDASALSKTHLLHEYDHRNNDDVHDPFGSNEQEYEDCFLEMKNALDNLFLDLSPAKNLNRIN